MPARIARSSAPQHFRERTSQRAQPKSKRDRNQDAFAIAQEGNPDRLKFRKHRYGEAESEGPTSSRKRQRESDEDDGSDSDEDHRENPTSKRPRVFDGLDAEDGSDSSGNEWHYGFDAEAGDEDEDIDSDEAFGESDGERFEDYTFRGSSSNKKSQRTKGKDDVDPDEEEVNDAGDQSDDSFGSDAVDLAAMLDNPMESDDEQAELPRKSTRKPSALLSTFKSHSGDGNDDDGVSRQESMSSASDEDADDEDIEDDHDPAKLAKLRSMVQQMEKAEQAPSDDEDDSANVKPGALLAAMQQIASGKKKPSRQDKQAQARDAPLSAPLPKRQQDKLNREAAYTKAKETLGKWQDTVKYNREADHLVFPLTDPTAQEAQGTSRMTIAAKPQNDLEFAIQGILEQSGLSGTTKDDDKEGDELPENKPSLKEVQARRAELRRARELLFREEQRSKRIKKIKSKAYRRVHRKEKEKKATSERNLLLNAGAELSDDEDAKEAHDRRRAEERMGTRHKESQWAKNAKKTGQLTWNDDARAGVEDMARRDEELRRRIQGQKATSESSESSSDEADSDDDDAFRLRATEKLDALDQEPEMTGQGGRLAGLAFMRRADAARKQANDEAVAALRRDLAANDDEGASNSGSDEEEMPLGRRVFGAPSVNDQHSQKKTKKNVRANELEEGDLSSDADIDGQVEPAPSSKTPAHKHTPTKQPTTSSTQAPAKLPRKPTKSALDAPPPQLSHPESSSKPHRPLPQTKHQPAPSNARNDSAASSASRNDDGDDDDNASQSADAEHDAPLSNAALIASAFGSDARTASSAFRKEKRALAASESAPADSQATTSTTLPGWGSWAGSGLSGKARKQRAPKPASKNSAAAAATSTSSQKRRDAASKDVIVSERRSRKNAKYLAPALPFPFESAAQYERGLRVPLGREWNARATVEANVKPRVIHRGGIVQPMSAPQR